MDEAADIESESLCEYNMPEVVMTSVADWRLPCETGQQGMVGEPTVSSMSEAGDIYPALLESSSKQAGVTNLKMLHTATPESRSSTADNEMLGGVLEVRAIFIPVIPLRSSYASRQRLDILGRRITCLQADLYDIMDVLTDIKAQLPKYRQRK